jgi:hypothetical protein
MSIREMRVDEAGAVRDLWNEMCETADARVPGGWGKLSDASLELIADNLARTPSHPDALCLVVEDNNTLVGFVTASVQAHPTSPGLTGEIEELYVRGGDDTTERELASRAIAWSFEHGANAVITHEASDAPWTEASVAFWRTIGFTIDRVVMHLYR